MMDTPDTTAMLESRYIRQSDPKTDTLVFPLHPAWWSRPYEYEWARQFARSSDVVLDAACGISHPFKFWLTEHCREVHACDWDERILSEEAIRLDIAADFGEQAALHLPEHYLTRLHRAQANLARLPMPTNSLTAYSASLFWNIWTRARCCELFANLLGC